MTNPDATQAIYDIIQMMITIGLPLCMVAGWRDTPKLTKNKQTSRRAKRGRRPASVKASDLVKDRKRKAKAAIPRPLSDSWFVAPKFSDEVQREYDAYHIKRQFVA